MYLFITFFICQVKLSAWQNLYLHDPFLYIHTTTGYLLSIINWARFTSVQCSAVACIHPLLLRCQYIASLLWACVDPRIWLVTR